MPDVFDTIDVNIMPAMDVYKSGYLKMRKIIELATYDHRTNAVKKETNSKDVLGPGQNYVLIAAYMKGEDVKIESSGLKVRSWVYPSEGLLFRRDTQIFTADGKQAANVILYFIPFDVEKRKSFHPTDEQKENHYSSLKAINESSGGTPRSRPNVRMQNPVFCERRKVRDSELDYMGHLNSCVYFSHIFDVLTEEERNKVLDESVMSYKRELLKDDEVCIYKEITPDAIIVEGRIPDTEEISFTCEIKLQD